MAETIHHECGIAAAVWVGGEGLEGPRDAGALIPGMLIDIQNRGQLAAGMSSCDITRQYRIRTHKGLGSVNTAFQMSDPGAYKRLMATLTGSVSIGHTRYGTAGADNLDYAQPFERQHGRPFKWMSFCFNGHVANHKELLDRLQNMGYHMTRPDSDTEIFMHYLTFVQRGMKQTDWVKAFGLLAKAIDGAWNLCLMNATGELVVARDPTGLRPLVWGQHKGFVLFASESVALQNLGVKDVRPVKPGTLIHVKNGKIEERTFAATKESHCFFEWIYFANVASNIDDRSVYQARANLGRALANIEPLKNTPDIKDHLVVPVPDTSKAAGDAFAYAMGIPSVEGLVRNRYVGRTFIEAGDRAAKVRRKFMAIRGILGGKKIFLVDDSIVRSTTLAYLIRYIREEGGASEVHVRIACPPIMGPCFYGIDMSTIAELFAPRYLKLGMIQHGIPDERLGAMAKVIGADSLVYLPPKALADCIGLPTERLCRACVDGRYPTRAGRKMYELARKNHAQGIQGRPTTEGCRSPEGSTR
jgi:amidophosphoribosyltransferase